MHKPNFKIKYLTELLLFLFISNVVFPDKVFSQKKDFKWQFVYQLGNEIYLKTNKSDKKIVSDEMLVNFFENEKVISEEILKEHFSGLVYRSVITKTTAEEWLQEGNSYKNAIYSHDVSLSPDNKSVIFTYEIEPKISLTRRKVYGILRYDLNKNRFQNIIQNNNYNIYGLKFSPDMNKILFLKHIPRDLSILKNFRFRTKYSLCILEIDTGEIKELVPETESIGVPSWSPDGNRIVFPIRKYSYIKNEKKYTSEIYIFEIKSKEKTFLTAGYSPEWCPVDENIIAYVSNDGKKLNLINYKTGKVKTILKSWVVDLGLQCWSSDGEYIIYTKVAGILFWGPCGYTSHVISTKGYLAF